jgi:diguanylate cyclase (GGDEF)-like protein/PAS domain S-box-containing protein
VLEIGLIVTAIEDFRVRRVNAAACQLLGRDESELVGMDWREFVDPDQLDEMIETSWKPLTAGLPDLRHLVRMIRGDGSVVQILAKATLETDPSDGSRRVLAQIQDVTELVTTHLQLHLILDHTPAVIFLIDRAGRVLASGGSGSPAVMEALAKAEDVGLYAVLADEPAGRELLRRALGGERVDEVVRVFGRWFDVHLVPFAGFVGQPPNVAGAVLDVTDREQAAAELRGRSVRQATLADLGQYVLESTRERDLWGHAARILADQLDTRQVTVRRGASARIAPGARAGDGAGDSDQCGLFAHEDLDGPGRAVRPDTGYPADADGTLLGSADEILAGRRHGATDGSRPAAGPEGSQLLTMPVGRVDDPTATIRIRRETSDFAPDEVEFVRSVAAMLGSAALRIQMEERARFRALHDPLTGLPNRAAVIERLRDSLRRGRPDQRRVGVLFIDLDGFKTVNDTLGHQAGDDLLCAVSARLRRVVRPGDVVGRLAGDEFAVLCEDVTGVADLEIIADRILSALASPVELASPVSIGGSIGLAVSGPGIDDADQLLNSADLAMYVAKRGGPGRAFAFDERMRIEAAARLNDGTELRRALDAGELVPLYAPIRSTGGAVLGAEVQAHWPHPARGLLGPDEVALVARDAGLSLELDRWLLAVVARALAGLDRRAPGLTRRVCLRISPPGLSDARLRHSIVELAGRARPGHRLCVVVPDRNAERDPAQVHESLRELGASGVIVYQTYDEARRSLGATSGRGLINGLWLDGRLGRDAPTDGVARAVVAASVRFAHVLGLEVVVDGVDTTESLDTVRALGCDALQGLAVGRPGPEPP